MLTDGGLSKRENLDDASADTAVFFKQVLDDPDACRMAESLAEASQIV